MNNLNRLSKHLLPICLILLFNGPVSGSTPEQNSLIQFPQSFLQGTPAPASIYELWQDSHQLGLDYQQLLDEESPFNGLYLRGEGWQSLEHDAYEYRIGLDLELYENGRYEAQRRQEKKELESSVQYLQLLNDMRVRTMDERLHTLHRLHERVLKTTLQAKQTLLDEQSQIISQEHTAGLVLQSELNQALRRQIENELKYEAIKGFDDIAISELWFNILNRAEFIELQDIDQLVETAKARSYSAKLQEKFSQRASFHHTWRDDLSLRLYIENRYNDYNQRHDTVAGVRVRLPLDKPRHRDELMEVEQASYAEQLYAIQHRLRQRLHDNVRLLKQHQANIVKHQKLHKLTQQQIENNNQHAAVVVPSLPYTPEKENRVLQRQSLDIQQAVLLERFKVLELIIKLSDLCVAERIDEILIPKSLYQKQ